jgi:hypothetical protein
MDIGTGTVSRPINLVGMDICRSLGYNFGSGIIIPEENPTRCHSYSRRWLVPLPWGLRPIRRLKQQTIHRNTHLMISLRNSCFNLHLALMALLKATMQHLLGSVLVTSEGVFRCKVF